MTPFALNPPAQPQAPCLPSADRASPPGWRTPFPDPTRLSKGTRTHSGAFGVVGFLFSALVFIGFYVAPKATFNGTQSS